MNSKRNIILDKNGVSPVLESLVAIGISISLLIVFFIAANSIYSTHDRPNVDLEAKSIDIMESLLNSPGQGVGYDPSWEMDVDNMSIIGLATLPTIEYGILNTSDEGEITVIYRERVSDSRIGIAKTCFLAGTKVVMADESYKNIEDIVVGDTVKSFDVGTGKIVNREVINTFHHLPEEMTDYYMVINDFLKITPNHFVYFSGSWVHAGDLKIGDVLSYPTTNITIHSIEKIYEKVSTYDLGIGINHCYFVAFYNKNVLVHNLIPPFANANGPYYGEPGEEITFDGTGSTEDPWEHDPIVQYDWRFYDGQPLQVDIGPNPTWIYNETGTYDVTLWVEDSRGDRSLAWLPGATTTAHIAYEPIAQFTWFDSDSLAPGTEISFDASSSSYGGDVATFEWWWDWNLSWDEKSPPPANKTGANPSYDFGDNGTYLVMLRVESSGINDTCIHAVQANTLNLPETDWRPWVATSKDIYPSSADDTLASFDKNYYVEYENLPDGNFSFEVKLKTNTNYIILDYDKVDSLKNASYSNVTSGLGLDTSTSIFYSVNITISNDEGIISTLGVNITISNDEGIISTLGPSYDNANVIESIYREVLIYHKPTISSIDNIIPPYYENGLITVHVFI